MFFIDIMQYKYYDKFQPRSYKKMENDKNSLF